MKTTPVLSAAGREATLVDNQLLDQLFAGFVKTAAEGSVGDHIRSVEQQLYRVRALMESREINPQQAKKVFTDIITNEFLSAQLMEAVNEYHTNTNEAVAVAID